MADTDIDDMTDMGELEQVTAQIEQQEKEVQQEAAPSLPEKYRGKKVEDVIKMHQEAEKLASRHAQEVGEIRKLADELIKSQLNKKPEAEVPKVDFFENPEEAVQQAINSSPKVRAAEEYAIMAQRQMALQTLATKHPDYREIDADSEFKEWIGASRVRQVLYNAAQNYDVDAADELLNTYKQLRSVKQRAVSEAEVAARNKAVTAASVDVGGSGETSKKIYSRKELIELQLRDPRKFESMRSKIDAAYREGRVK